MPQPDGVLPHDPGGARGERPLLAVGRRQPFSRGAGLMSRRSTTHRRIINDKADYISGRGGVRRERTLLGAFAARVNGRGETMRQVLNRLAFDKALVRQRLSRSGDRRAADLPLSLYHQDASRCRVARDSQHVLLHHDWAAFNPAEARVLPPVAPHRAAGGWHGALDGALWATTNPCSNTTACRRPTSRDSTCRPSPTRPTAGTSRGWTTRFSSRAS